MNILKHILPNTYASQLRPLVIVVIFFACLFNPLKGSYQLSLGGESRTSVARDPQPVGAPPEVRDEKQPRGANTPVERSNVSFISGLARTLRSVLVGNTRSALQQDHLQQEMQNQLAEESPQVATEESENDGFHRSLRYFEKSSEPLFHFNLLKEAIDSGKRKNVEKALAAGANPAAQSPCMYETALHYCASNGDLETLKLLATRAPITSVDSYGYSLMHNAVDNGKLNVVQWLLSIDKTLLSKTDKYGNTALHLAVKKAFPEIVRVLCNNGADVNATANFGMSPLHEAFNSNAVECVAILLERKPKLYELDEYGSTAMHVIINTRNISADNRIAIAKLLLQADPMLMEKPNKIGKTPYLEAMCHGNQEMVKWLEQNKANKDVTARIGKRALHCAAEWGNSKTICLALPKDQTQAKRDLAVRDDNGNTPLLSACNSTYHDKADERDSVITFLVSSIKDVHSTQDADNLIDAFNADGRSALHCASYNGYLKAVTTVLSNVTHPIKSLAMQDMNGDTPLHSALHASSIFTPKDGENLETITFLAQKMQEVGANMNAVNHKNETALQVAVKTKQTKAAKALLAVEGVATDITSHVSSTPLNSFKPIFTASLRSGLSHYSILSSQQTAPYVCSQLFTPDPEDLWELVHTAAHTGNAEMLELLLSKAEDPEALANKPTLKKGLTPLHLAAHSGNVACLKVLAKYKPNVAAETVNGYTALHAAAANKKAGKEAFQFLIDMKVPEGSSPFCWPLLHVACQSGNAEITKLLLEKGADKNDSYRGWTPADCAAYSGDDKVMEALRDVGANLDLPDDNDVRPIHIAANKGSLAMIRILAERGANHTDPTKDKGWTPLHCAVAQGSLEITEYLLNRYRLDFSDAINAKTKEGHTALDFAKVTQNQALIDLLK